MTRDEALLASATLVGRSLGERCTRTEAVGEVSTPSGWSAPVYVAATLTCRTENDVLVQVHPILERDKPAGSTLLVLAPDARTLIVSAPLKEGGSRIYYDGALCTPAE